MTILTIRRLETDADLMGALALMTELRGDMIVPATFAADVRAQESQGYRLFGAFAAGTGELLGLAGVRVQRTMSRGWHLFCDDLVTRTGDQGKGVGRALVAFMQEDAMAAGMPALYLDSRATAKGFYEKLGFTFLTAIPCFKKLPLSGRRGG